MPQSTMKQQQQQQQQSDIQAIYKKTRYNNNNNTTPQQQNQKRSNAAPASDDQLTPLERAEQTCESLNYERRVDAVSCGSVAAANGVKTPTNTSVEQHIYENVKFDLRRSQQRLLQKFFRCNLAPSEAIYENLCRGCGYGVFEARGQLCNFCACIVNGLKTRVEVVEETFANVDASENIYENVCGQCAAVYSSDECDYCLAKAQSVAIFDSQCENKCDDSDKLPSSDKCTPAPVATKLHKSKSFNKRDKRNIFYGLIGSLKRSVKTTNTPPTTPAQKPLQIVHNVDGFENVFRTQETFDLQRICELKSQQLVKQSSRSDQHIYGRLKCSRETLGDSAQTLPTQLTQSLSHDQLLLPDTSVDSLSASAGNLLEQRSETLHVKKAGSAGKRPRISKPRLLRSRSQGDTNKINNNSEPSLRHANPPAPKLSLYLADSVCYWMTSLRREVHNYRTCGSSVDDEQLELCQPKSVPAKHTPVYSAPSSGLLAPHADEFATLLSNIPKSDKLQEIKRQTTATATTSNEISVRSKVLANCENIDNLTDSEALRMVADFKRNLLAKQSAKQQQQTVDTMSTTTTPTTEIAAAATTKAETAPRSPRSPRSPAELAQQRTKRQAIYLKMDNNNAENNINSNITSCDNHNNNSSNRNNNNDANANCTSRLDCTVVETATTAPTTTAQFIDETAVAAAAADIQLCAVGEHGLAASRQAARQALTTAGKRRGIYKRDSEFVAHILCAFDNFLQRESDPDAPADTPNESQSQVRPQQSDLPSEALSVGGVGEVDEHAGGSSEAVTARQRHNEDVGAITVLIDDHTVNNSTPPTSSTTQRWCQATLLVQPLVPRDFAISAQLTDTPTYAIAQILNVVQLVNNLLISRSLNNVVIYYDKSLLIFLQRISDRGITDLAHDRWVRKFRRFYAHSQRAFAALKRAENSLTLTLAKGDDVTLNSRNVTLGESVVRRCRAKQNGSDCVGVVSECCEAPKRRSRASAQIVLKRVSLIEASDVCEEPQPDQVLAVGVAKEGHKSSELKYEGVDCAVESSENDNNQVMKNNNDEVLLRPKAKDSAVGRNEKALGKFMESLDNVAQVLELSEASADAIKTVSAVDAATASVKCASAASKITDSVPQVPVRDPKTSLTTATSEHNSPTLSIKSESQVKDADKMTVPSADKTSNNNKNKQQHQEEDIYQPIWKFKTVGEVQERYQTDADYYDVSSLAAITATAAAAKSSRSNDSSALLPSILISENVEDHGEWETDDEFMFSTQPLSSTCGEDDGYSVQSGTIRSTGSAGSTVSGSVGSTVSGSTVTGFGSSTATLGSTVSSSLQHPLLRSVGIFYSLLEPKLRAIVYEYDRVHAPLYFAKRRQETKSEANDSGLGKSSPEPSPKPPPRTSSAAKSTVAACENENRAKVTPKMQLLPDSVQAWKFMLLDVNYLEDEEDMIVSEQEILRAQQLKEDIDSQAAITAPQPNVLQRFKSASFGNLIDLPNEDDKKSIAERMRNKLQRGVFKLNVRSPKSEKKSRGIFRRTDTASLYLEDGMKPKYPIFGAPLEQLELNQRTHPNVPRFVVDCVEYIERKDCILQDGLYRASGNKVSIDELKQKLSESYIYDPKLLVADDLHTLTSLLKQFFRELGAPLIPQETYARFGQNVTDAAGIETLRVAIEQMVEPNRSTLQFLIRHLKNVAAYSNENRMPASNLAIVWGPCIFSANQVDFVDIGRMNTLAKVLIENYERIFGENERLVS